MEDEEDVELEGRSGMDNEAVECCDKLFLKLGSGSESSSEDESIWKVVAFPNEDPALFKNTGDIPALIPACCLCNNI